VKLQSIVATKLPKTKTKKYVVEMGMGTGFKAAGLEWGWKKIRRAWFGRNYLDAAWVRVEVVTRRGGDGVK